MLKLYIVCLLCPCSTTFPDCAAWEALLGLLTLSRAISLNTHFVHEALHKSLPLYINHCIDRSAYAPLH